MFLKGGKQTVAAGAEAGEAGDPISTGGRER